MSKPGKIILSGGLILGSAAYALWQHEQMIPPPPIRLVAEKARQAAPIMPALPAPALAPSPPDAVAATAPQAPQAPAPEAPKPQERIARSEKTPEALPVPAAAEPAPPETPPPPPPEPLNAVQLAPPPAASTGRYADGEFVGNAVDDEWGPVQVKVVVKNGDIADVICIEYPFHRQRSAEISEWAIPTLVEETIKAQSEKIDWISQASFTSDQFQKSLASALARAQKAAHMMPDFLRRISVHKLVLYYLVALLALAEIFCITGILPYRAMDLLYSTVLIWLSCFAGNLIFAAVWGINTNIDSVMITALILVLIITPMPPHDLLQTGYAIFASLWAMAAKFVLTISKRNIFNPAAFGVALAAAALGSSVSWWIGGSLYLLPLALAGGLLILIKMNAWEMVGAFAAADILTVAITAPAGDPLHAVSDIVFRSMFFFFAFVMLTEPRTAPLGRANRILYGALVGVLFAPEIHVGVWYTTPEIALLTGNAFAALTYVQRRRAVSRTA